MLKTSPLDIRIGRRRPANKIKISSKEFVNKEIKGKVKSNTWIPNLDDMTTKIVNNTETNPIKRLEEGKIYRARNTITGIITSQTSLGVKEATLVPIEIAENHIGVNKYRRVPIKEIWKSKDRYFSIKKIENA